MSINSALFNVIAAATAPLGTGTTGVISKVRGLDEQKQNQVVRKYENQMDRDETFNNDIKRNNHNEFKSVTSDSVPIMLKEKESNVGTVFLNGIFLASFAGTLLSTIILIFGKQFIRQVFQIKDEFLITTVEYLKIRGLSLPAVLLNYIVFGFSIAMQDVMAPILSIITAFLVNVFGDFVLVGKLGYGLSGAAAATTISSYLGSFVALKHIIKRYNIKLPHTRENTALARDDKVTNGRKIEVKNDNNDNINKNKKIAWDQIVSKKGLNMFFSASGPLLIGALVNTLTYSAGARIASFTKSPTQATLEIAAHQIVMQSWWFLSYFSSPFSLVAQAVIPKDIIKNDNKRVRKMITLLLQLTSIVGILVTLCNIFMIKSFPGIFTQNMTIQKIFQNVLIPSSLSLFIICLSTVSDGIFIGCNFISDYLKASYLSTLAAWIYYSYSIKNKLGIIGAWNGLLIFSVVRMSFYLIVYPKLWSSFSKRETDSGSYSDSQI